MKVTQHAMPLTWIIHFDFVFRNKGEKNEEGKGNNFFFKSLAFGVTPLIDKNESADIHFNVQCSIDQHL